MFYRSVRDPYEVPQADDVLVRIEFPEGEEALVEWAGLVLYQDGAAPIVPEEEVVGEIKPHTEEGQRLLQVLARRELLALSPLARVGAASSEANVFLSAYAAVDPESRCGYLEVWIGDQDAPEVSEPVCDVLSLRALLSEGLQRLDDEAADLGGQDHTALDISFVIPKELPRPKSEAAKAKSAKARAAKAKATKAKAAKAKAAKKKLATLTRPKAKRLVRELMARGTIADPEDDDHTQAVVALAEQLRRAGYAPRLETKCADYELGNFSVGAYDVERRLYFGKILAGSWKFSMSGEAGQYMTGLMIETDTEIPIFDEQLLRAIGVDFDCYGDFPTSWNEALERFGDYDEDDDDDDDEDNEDYDEGGDDE